MERSKTPAPASSVVHSSETPHGSRITPRVSSKNIAGMQAAANAAAEENMRRADKVKMEEFGDIGGVSAQLNSEDGKLKKKIKEDSTVPNEGNSPSVAELSAAGAAQEEDGKLKKKKIKESMSLMGGQGNESINFEDGKKKKKIKEAVADDRESMEVIERPKKTKRIDIEAVARPKSALSPFSKKSKLEKENAIYARRIDEARRLATIQGVLGKGKKKEATSSETEVQFSPELKKPAPDTGLTEASAWSALPVLGPIVGGGLDYYDRRQKGQSVLNALVGGISSAIGGEAGEAVGSAAGPLGTIGGGIAGQYGGGALYDKLVGNKDSDETKTTAPKSTDTNVNTAPAVEPPAPKNNYIPTAIPTTSSDAPTLSNQQFTFIPNSSQQPFNQKKTAKSIIKQVREEYLKELNVGTAVEDTASIIWRMMRSGKPLEEIEKTYPGATQWVEKNAPEWLGGKPAEAPIPSVKPYTPDTSPPSTKPTPANNPGGPSVAPNQPPGIKPSNPDTSPPKESPIPGNDNPKVVPKPSTTPAPAVKPTTTPEPSTTPAPAVKPTTTPEPSTTPAPAVKPVVKPKPAVNPNLLTLPAAIPLYATQVDTQTASQPSKQTAGQEPAKKEPEEPTNGNLPILPLPVSTGGYGWRPGQYSPETPAGGGNWVNPTGVGKLNNK